MRDSGQGNTFLLVLLTANENCELKMPNRNNNKR